MRCPTCHLAFSEPHCPQCGWRGAPTPEQKGPTLRLNPCDVPGCGRILNAGNPEKNLAQGLRLPVRCRFHRNPRYVDPPRVPSQPRLPDPGPFVPFSDVKEEFERIRAASGRALRAYWAKQGITVRPPAPLPSGWTSLRTGLRQWADKWFPPVL